MHLSSSTNSDTPKLHPPDDPLPYSLTMTEGPDQPLLTTELASNLASLPMRCIRREYPNKLDHVINGPEDVQSPRQLHPSFYGCFDWHSSVHGHWMLISLLKRFDLSNANPIRAMLRDTLSGENLQSEADYLDQPGRQSFERTYGWAWLLKLAEELHAWDDPDGVDWSRNLKPLEEKIVARYFDFLPRQAFPIRHGLHANTAFGLTFSHDYSVSVGNAAFQAMLETTALRYYAGDEGFSDQSEPGGSDFLSPVLAEADLMRRVLPPSTFSEWFERFLPTPARVLTPVESIDRDDPQIGHLDGLNLSRAWCLKGIAKALPEGCGSKTVFEEASLAHANLGLKNVETGNYEGEHWLASLAIYLLISER